MLVLLLLVCLPQCSFCHGFGWTKLLFILKHACFTIFTWSPYILLRFCSLSAWLTSANAQLSVIGMNCDVQLIADFCTSSFLLPVLVELMVLPFFLFRNHMLLAQADCVRHACAMRSLAIVITIVQSFFLFLLLSVFCF